MATFADAARRVVEQSERRARKAYAFDAISRLEQYSGILEFARQIANDVRDFPWIQCILYFPTQIEQLFCLATESNRIHFKIYETTDYRTEAKKIVGALTEMLNPDACNTVTECVFVFPRPEAVNMATPSSVERLCRKLVTGLPPVEDAERSVLLVIPIHRRFMRRHLDGALASLQGILILTSTQEAYDDSLRMTLVQTVWQRVESYFRAKEILFHDDHALLSAYYRYEARSRLEAELDREKKQSASIIALGQAVFLLVHRFVGFRRAASTIATIFQTAADVNRFPVQYEQNVANLRLVLERTSRFEDILRKAKRDVFATIAESQQRTVKEVINILNDYLRREVRAVVNQGKSEADAIVLKVWPLPSPEVLQTKIRWYAFFEEGLQVVVENAMRAVMSDVGYKKGLILQVSDEGSTVAFALVNYGPRIPDHILADIQSHRPVYSAEGTGLGLFFTWTLMQFVGGDLRVDNVPTAEDCVRATLSFPKLSRDLPTASAEDGRTID